MLISIQYSSHEEQTRHAAQFLKSQGYNVEPPDSDRITGRTEAEPRRRKRSEPQEQATPPTNAASATTAKSQRRPAQTKALSTTANHTGTPTNEMSALGEKKVKVSSESPSPNSGHSPPTTVPKRGRKPKLDDSGPTPYSLQEEINSRLTGSATARKKKAG